LEKGLKNTLSEVVGRVQAPFTSSPPEPFEFVGGTHFDRRLSPDERRSQLVLTGYERLSRLYQLLKRTNAEIIFVTDRKSLFLQLNKILSESRLFSMASVSTIAPMTGELESVCTCCERPSQNSLASELFDQVFSRHCAGKAGEPLVLNNLGLDVSGPSWREMAFDAGLHSFASLPMTFDGIFYGTLALFSNATNHFDADLVDLLHQVAKNVAYTLHSIDESIEVQTYELGLSESRRELKELLLHLHSAREDERSLVARELHDELGQTLNTLKLDLFALSNGQSIKVHLQEKRLARMTEAIEHALDEVHRVVSALCPRILSDLGLGPAVEWLVNDFNDQSGISCQLKLDLPPQNDIPRTISTAAFRCIQEFLTNLRQRSVATSASIRITLDRALLSLAISDNGRSNTPHSGPTADSFGNISIRQRVELLGGSLKRINRSGHGTCIEIVLPIIEQTGQPTSRQISVIRKKNS
jgi:signal transduction histidine kinase